jgi:serine protease Do
MPQQNTARATFAIGVLCLVASLFVVGVGHAEWTIWNPFGGSASSASSSVSTVLPGGATKTGASENQIIDVVKQSQPSVASVIITEELPVIQQEFQNVPFGNPFQGLNGFNDPFQQFQIQIPRQVQKGTQKTEVGGGTAFFVTSDGLLMTNKHVVQDPKAQYTVLLNDGRKLDATVAGLDPANDIALLKVKGSGFTPLTISSTDDVQLGQTAIAIGNALGEFRNTVSVGVVSGLRRSITAGGMLDGNPERLDQIIQTDAAINQGNSGGPLLDTRGEVIGMNTAVAASAQNIGFALPAGELRRVLTSYQKNGRIIQTYLGVRYVPVTSDVQTQYKLSYDYGDYVTSGENSSDPAILPGSPAEKAGLKGGDIILEADGQKLTQDVSLQRLVQSKAPGDTMTLKIARDGKEQTLTVTLQELKQG